MKNTLMPKLELKKILSKAQLPGLPQSLIQILDITRNPNNGCVDIAGPVEVDQGLTGQVLQLVNSSYFGFSRRISSIKMAVILLGIPTIRSFVLWSAVYCTMSNTKYGLFYLKSLWQDSLRRALFARILAKMLDVKDAEEAFAAALLQDIAIPILAKESPQSYEKLLDSRQQGKVRLSHLENQAFGWTHAQAGCMMAQHWHLPDHFANLIEEHTDIEKLIAQSHETPDKAAVALSALLPTVADPLWMECRQLESYYAKIAPKDSPAILELFEQIDKEFDQFAPLMKLATPAKSLVDYYNEATVSA